MKIIQKKKENECWGKQTNKQKFEKKKKKMWRGKLCTD